MGGDRLYPVAGHRVVTNTIRVVWGAPVLFVGGAYAEGREEGIKSPGLWGTGCIRVAMVQERARTAGKTKLLPVIWNPI
jgi:hypothetical protein